MSTPEEPVVPTPEDAPGSVGLPAPEGSDQRRPRFVRARRGRLVGGVCSGLGSHFGVDPLLLRIAFVGLTFLAGVGVWLYLAILLFTPEEGARRAPIALLGSSWQLVLGAVTLIARVRRSRCRAQPQRVRRRSRIRRRYLHHRARRDTRDARLDEAARARSRQRQR